MECEDTHYFLLSSMNKTRCETSGNHLLSLF